MSKKYKIRLTVIIVLLILVGALGALRIFWHKEELPKEKNDTKIISNIDKYGYTLDDRDTKYMKETFKELDDILSKEEVDESAYASTLAKLFIIDLYTLNNKINKYDIGSLEYILSEKVEMFKLKAMDTLYGDIIDNTYKDRIQKLPEIKEVTIEGIETSTIKIGEQEEPCYKVTMKYSYKQDLGYDKEGTIYLVERERKLEVAKYDPKIN